MVRAELNYGHGVRLISLIAAVVLVAGCSNATTTGGEPTTQAVSTPEAPRSESTPVPEPSTSEPSTSEPSTSEPSTPEQPRECEQVMFQRAQGTIRSQQSAFAQQDFAAARAYASEFFRAGVSVAGFEAIIKGQYAFLLADPAIEFVDCQRLGESALIRVKVADPASSSTVTMVYRVVLENESWFIDAASIADRRTEVTA